MTVSFWDEMKRRWWHGTSRALRAFVCSMVDARGRLRASLSTGANDVAARWRG